MRAMGAVRRGRFPLDDVPREDPYPACDETYRAHLTGTDPEGGDHTLIVTARRDGAVWLTVAGSIRTTVVLRDQRIENVVTMLREAKGARPRDEKRQGEITRVRPVDGR